MCDDAKKKKIEEEFREKKWREGRIASEKLEADMRSEIEGLTETNLMLKR